MFSFVSELAAFSPGAWFAKNFWRILIVAVIGAAMWFAFSTYSGLQKDLAQAKQTIGKNTQQIDQLTVDKAALQKQIKQHTVAADITNAAEAKNNAIELAEVKKIAQRQTDLKKKLVVIRKEPTSTPEKKTELASTAILEDLWVTYCDSPLAVQQEPACKAYSQPVMPSETPEQPKEPV